MIDVILADNTRPACGGPQLIRYYAGGVLLALVKNGLEARWVDLITHLRGNASALPEQSKADVYCYAVFFGNKQEAFRHMREARISKKAPRLIIAFGPFASAFPEEILSRGLADIVVSTDPEFVIPALLLAGYDPAHWENVPNISYQYEGKIVHTQKQSFHNLDEIPFIGPFLNQFGHRPALVVTARGCQYHCVFCDRNAFWGGGVRQRSIPNVIDEVKELVEVQHVQKIQFYDEDLPADRKRLAVLCQGLRRIKGIFYWECAACIDSVSRELLLLMWQAGCRQITFGMESASSQVLRRIGKTYGREEIINAVRWSLEAGLKVIVQITIGNPGETDLDQAMTLSTLKELGPDVQVKTNQLVILPGTPFYRKGLREGWYTQQSFFEHEGIIFYHDMEQKGATL